MSSSPLPGQETEQNSWQYRWKRPKWTSCESTESGRIVHHVSALVDAHEVDQPAEVVGSSTLVLSATLLSTRGTADVIIIDLEATDNEGTRILKRQRLQWPESILTKPSVIEEEQEEEEDPEESTSIISSIMSALRPKRVRKGLVSCALVRETGPVRETSNALNVLQLLAIGADPIVNVAEQDTASGENVGDLHLACVSREGIVYIYDALSLLNPAEQVQTDAEDMFMGPLFSRLSTMVRPLSNPMATVALSVCIQRQADQFLWDSTLDTNTLAFATQKNEPRLVSAVWNYLVVAGSGVPKPVESNFDSASSVASSNLSQDTEMTTTTRNGGFVTFLTTRSQVEVQTLFLPFSPISIGQWFWEGGQYLTVLGEAQAIAIRTDAPTRPSDEVGKFQVIPIGLPQFNMIPPRMFGSSSPCSVDLAFFEANCFTIVREKPVGLELLPVSSLGNTVSTDWAEYGRTINKEGTDCLPFIRLEHSGRDVANLVLQGLDCEPRDLWCESGQGFSLVGIHGRVFFVCWEGKTIVRELVDSEWSTSSVSSILPMRTLPVPLSLEMDSALELELPSFESPSPDDIIAEALQSLSPSPRSSERKRSGSRTEEVEERLDSWPLSNQEKIRKLLSFCPSWTKLQRISEDVEVFEPQVPMLTVSEEGNVCNWFIL